MAENDNETPIQILEMSKEMSALVRHQYELDRAEAGPKLPIERLNYPGVILESRFSVAGEFETMKRVVDALPDLARARLESIWCDSRAFADYRVQLVSGRWSRGIKWDVRAAFLNNRQTLQALP